MKILIAGEGGQGVQLAAEILARAAILENKQATYIPNFGVEQRGGISLAFVIINNQSIAYPKFLKADILVEMCERAKERTKNYIGFQTQMIDASQEDFKSLPQKVQNMYILGKLIKVIKYIKLGSVKSVLEQQLAAKFIKKPQLKKDNWKALDQGYIS